MHTSITRDGVSPIESYFGVCFDRYSPAIADQQWAAMYKYGSQELRRAAYVPGDCERFRQQPEPELGDLQSALR